MATAISIFYLFRDPNCVFMHALISSQRKQHPFFTNINKPAASGFPHFTWQNLKPKTMSLDFKLKLTDDPPNTKKVGRDSEGRKRKGSWGELGGREWEWAMRGGVGNRGVGGREGGQ